MTKLRSIISKILPIFGVLLFVFILNKVGLASIWETLKGINFVYFGIAVLLLVPAVFLKAYKWKKILNALDVSCSFIESLKIILISYFVGSLTPARLGDFSRALYLKKHGVSLPKGFSSVLIDRIFDLGTLILMAGVGAIALVSIFSIAFSSVLMIALIAIIFAVVIFFVLKKNFMRRILRPFFYMLIPEKYQKQLIDVFDDFYNSIAAFSKNLSSLFLISALTLLSWFVIFLSDYFAARALGIEISYFLLVLILPFVPLVEALPISFSGIGTRDALLILMFSFLAIPASQAVSFSLMILVMSYILNFAGIFLWIKNPFKI